MSLRLPILMAKSVMASFRWISGKRWSETDSITSSMMSFGDEFEIPKFVFTTEDDIDETLQQDEDSEPAFKRQQSHRSESDPTEKNVIINGFCKKMNSKSDESEDSGILTPEECKNIPLGKLRLEVDDHNLDRSRKTLSAPPSPSKYRSTSPTLHRSFRHNIRREFIGDSVSVINVPVVPSSKDVHEDRRSLSEVMSGIYAVFLLMLGAIIYMNDQHRAQKLFSEVFRSVISLMGLAWLIIFYIDLCRYKNTVLKQLKAREEAMQEASDKFSTATEFIVNSGANLPDALNNGEGRKVDPPPYRFLLGRHSGSFYLKFGSACFCFGHLINQGLQLAQHVLNFFDDDIAHLNCSRLSSVVLLTISPIHAFFQLFIAFKYSNVVINRLKGLARFGLMHIIATCVCNWFNTIVDEAVEDYNHMTANYTTNYFDIASFHVTVEKKTEFGQLHSNCTSNSILSTRSMIALPYLYPFTIEYNLLLAGVWFIVWQNIGKEHMNANPHHLRHTISQDEEGEAIAYQSNIAINVDCHSANKGLFFGLLLMISVVITVIVFYVDMSTHGYQHEAVIIHTCQEGGLTLIGLLLVIVAFYQIRKLDRSENPITFLDDVLLFIPLPFFFVHGIMSILSELENENYSRLALHTLVTLEVIVQTPFIIDGLRRCSNSQELRYKKPGREIITFLIILNISIWIVNTFELKSVEQYHGQGEYFGELVWLFIGHTTLPLMLFYRFHSSVCLADMWKSAYEKEH